MDDATDDVLHSIPQKRRIFIFLCAFSAGEEKKRLSLPMLFTLHYSQTTRLQIIITQLMLFWEICCHTHTHIMLAVIARNHIHINDIKIHHAYGYSGECGETGKVDRIHYAKSEHETLGSSFTPIARSLIVVFAKKIKYKTVCIWTLWIEMWGEVKWMGYMQITRASSAVQKHVLAERRTEE